MPHAKNSDYVYSMVLYQGRSRGHQLATRAIEANFATLREWAVFQAARRAGGRALVLDPRSVDVGPRWDSQLGEPYISGLEVQVAGQQQLRFEIPLKFFRCEARRAANDLLEEGKLAPGDEFCYAVCAYRRAGEDSAAVLSDDMDDGLVVEDVAPPLNLPDHRLADYHSAAQGDGTTSRDDYPVFVPDHVIHEAIDLTEQAGAVETGGILIGHLFRDSDGGDIFAHVTAQIPASCATQSLTRLTFNPETWVAVDAARTLRGRNECYLGWWHSHPARQWCSDCPVERRMRCKLTGEFFSEHDAALHRAIFPKAFSIALVISDSYANGVTWPLFGWHYGMLEQRGFHILERPLANPEA
jgi:hypothetical protein